MVPPAQFQRCERAGKCQFTEHQLRSKLPDIERNLKEVFHEAAQLPERDRATLAGLLIETLDPVSEPDVEAAWSEEIKRRLTKIEAGIIELIPWEEVRGELFGQPNESYDNGESFNPR